jgi:(p)ppGpp synthase/HD superfamily hydrolase
MNYAQTNLQLMNQLVTGAYDAVDRALIANAYRLAMRLHTGWFRASGKTFIAHVVGTASVLAWLRASANTVSAGLLHAAYTHGEFAAGDEPSRSSRAQVIAAVGADVERLVTMYWALQWNPATIAAFASPESVRDLEPLQRELLLVRLANELEDHLDLAALYSLGPARGRAQANAFLRPARALADLLGLPALGWELERVRRETELGTIEASFGNATISMLIPPRTHRLKLKLAVAERVAMLKAGRSALRVYQRIKRSVRNPR